MLELFLLSLVLLFALLAAVLFHLYSRLKAELTELKFLKSSQSVKYGKLTEQWLPLSRDFPFSSENFRFIGSPVDGIAFEPDKIVICEFKASTSSLNEKQKRVRALVKAKRVEWFEARVE